MRKALPAIAYTYTEPLTWWEYMFDIASLAQKNGLKNILVSAGYVEKDPLRELLPFIDAANIDIKSMDDSFYRKYCGAALQPVLDNILTMVKAGVHVEITNLLVTGLNDSQESVARLCSWMVENNLSDIPLHFSRYFPRYRMREPGPTPRPVLDVAAETAVSAGIRTV